MAQDFVTRLLYARKSRLVGKAAYYLLKLLGVEIPLSVEVGPGCILEHGGFGVVVHSRARLGSRVKIYPGVVLGRTDIYRPVELSRFEGIEIEDEAILCPGAKILCKQGVLRVGRGTVIGSNAVLLQSTGEYELWAGMPARCVGPRPRNEIVPGSSAEKGGE